MALKLAGPFRQVTPRSIRVVARRLPVFVASIRAKRRGNLPVYSGGGEDEEGEDEDEDVQSRPKP